MGYKVTHCHCVKVNVSLDLNMCRSFVKLGGIESLNVYNCNVLLVDFSLSDYEVSFPVLISFGLKCLQGFSLCSLRIPFPIL